MHPKNPTKKEKGGKIRFVINFKSDKRLTYKSILSGLLLSLFFLSVNFAQTVQNTKNTADQALRSNSRVNPSSLGLEINVPLRSYPGRGISLPLGLNYSSKLWRFEEHTTILLNNGTSHVFVKAKYSENTASGWMTSISQPFIEYTGEMVRFDGSGRPLLEIYPPGQQGPGGNIYVKRITVYLPGGSVHELVASEAPISIPEDQIPPSSAWDTVFYAADGSGLKYVQSSTSNPPVYKLYLSDGSYYDFKTVRETKSAGEPYMQVRRAQRLTDVNGNYVEFYLPNPNDPTEMQNYPNGYWLDQLDRKFPVMIPRETPNQPVNQTFVLPGMTQGYTLKWKRLLNETTGETAFTLNQNYQLKYAGHTDLDNNPYTPSLFYYGNQMGPCSSNHLRVMVQQPTKFNPVVLTEIVLPNGQSYKFTYNEFAEIERIHYPTGGREEIQLDKVTSLAELAPAYQMSNRGVTQRKIYESDGNPSADTWTFSAQASTNNFRTSAIAPDGTRFDRFMHRGAPEPPCNQQSSQGVSQNWYGPRWGYDNILSGMVYEERVFSSAGQLLQRNLTRWTATNTSTVLTVAPQRFVQRNARILTTESVIYDNDAGLSTATAYEYDTDVDTLGSMLNVVKIKDYAYKVISGGSSIYPNETPPANIISLSDPTVSAVLSKSVETVFLQSDPGYDQPTKDAYRNNNLLGLVTKMKTRNGNDTMVTQTEIKYDEPNFGGGGYRGQQTRIRNWLNTNDIWYDVRSKYDAYGNIIETTDAKGNVTKTEYDTTYHAYAVKVITPTPDIYNITGSNTPLQTTIAYEPVTGLSTSVTDANGQTTQMLYEDALLRPTKTIAANGQQIITEYGAGTTSATRYVKVRTQIDESKWKENYTWFDGLERAIVTQSIDTDGDVFEETEFDNMGRAKRTTNAFRLNETKQWTEIFYDSLGRVVKVKTPDLAEFNTSYGLALSGSQIGISVTVMDQAGKLRRSITDALGHLIRIDEPNLDNQLGTVSSPNQPTFYAYDVTGNLTSVTQGAQTRTFIWNSLKQLKQVTNPETGTVNYNYDENGNMTSRTDARNITLTCNYDTLNRVLTRTFTGETDYQTPAVTYTYDNAVNGKGRVVKVTTGNVQNPFSLTEYTEFDALGRIKKSKQKTDGVDFPEMTYVYNLAGILTEQKYASGRVVKTVLENDGKLSMVQSRKNANTGFWNYASHFTYTAAGNVASMQLGNGKWESRQLNVTQQPILIGLGTTQNATNLLKLEYAYGKWENGTLNEQKNNGNPARQIITVPTSSGGQGFTAVQTYDYDSLNRLKEATEKIGTTETWRQVYTYDRYGNLNFDEANTLINGAQVVNSRNRELLNPDISEDDNRIIEDQDGDYEDDYHFDSSGNLDRDAQGLTYVYDADNKQVRVTNSEYQIIGEYFYDGSGKRVKKISQQETVFFVYNAIGQLVAEYANQTSQTPMVSYLTKDKIGSPRINTDQNGIVVARHDYRPFGEEITRQNYGADHIRRRFTSYERDIETELDFAQARMYKANLGRFTTPDNVLNDADRASPQSWNLYSYTHNNPLSYTDPTGKEIWIEYEEEIDGEMVKRRVQVIEDENGNLIVADAAAINNPAVQKALEHLKRLQAFRPSEFNALLRDGNKHDVKVGKGLRGHTNWNRTDNGTVDTTSYYDPDSEGAIVTLASQLLGAAYNASYGNPYPYYQDGRYNWKYFYDINGGCCVTVTGQEEATLKMERDARNDFGLPPMESWDGGIAPNLDKEINLDGRPEECKGIGCSTSAPTSDDDDAPLLSNPKANATENKGKGNATDILRAPKP